MAISPISRHLIDLDQQLPGQRRFISCWLTVMPDLVFVVDPGPPSTADHLLGEMDKLGVDRLDFILLTHVHLDHGGCTARILERWPTARVICHERGRRHLIDPTRLWAGSREVLGRKAEVYGQPMPVAAAAIADFATARGRGIEIIDTPGHAPHHVAFSHAGGLFLGECAGTFSDLGQGARAPEYYLRPATPPRFRLETALDSLDRVLALSPFPERLYFAHHGRHEGDTRLLITTARNQLVLWTTTVAECLAALQALPHTEQPSGEDDLLDYLRQALRAVDPYYARGDQLPPDIQERERDFSHQTLRGILGYLRARDAEMRRP